METGNARVTVYFEDPFWVGVLEREWCGELEVCKFTFGPEPKDYEVYDFLLQHWRELVFSPPVAASGRPKAVSPKRMQKAAAAQVHGTGVGTKAQQALQLQREQNKQQRRTDRRDRDAAEEERKFQLRQAKKKEKRRGH